MRRVDIMFPVYWGNLHEIDPCLERVLPSFTEALQAYDWRVIFAVNGKSPEWLIAHIEAASQGDSRIGYDYTPTPGKGSGVIHSWTASTAEILCYMDVDLSTDIRDVGRLVAGVANGADLCIGSRYHPDSVVDRSLKRKLISIIYHKYYMKLVLGARSYSDAQCGFKAINRRVLREVIPLVRNRSWFFESEMLYFAQRKHLSILEIPVRWKESRFSGVTLYKAIWEFLRSSVLLRLRRIGPT